MPVVYGYTRVSTGHQAKHGYSLEAQDEELKLWIAKEVPASYERGPIFVEEGVSAYTKDFARRPMGRALNRILQKGDVVVIMRLDRGFRSIRDMHVQTHAWEKRGVTLVIAQVGWLSGFSAKIVNNALAVAAEMESSIKSERGKEINRKAKREGRIASGSLPAGLKKYDKRLRPGVGHLVVIDRVALKRAAKIIYLKDDCGWGLRRIARAFSRWVDPNYTDWKFRYSHHNCWPVSRGRCASLYKCLDSILEHYPALHREAKEFVDKHIKDFRERRLHKSKQTIVGVGEVPERTEW